MEVGRTGLQDLLPFASAERADIGFGSSLGRLGKFGSGEGAPEGCCSGRDPCPGTSRSRCACLRSIAASIQLRIALRIIPRTLDSPLMSPRQFFLLLILREPSHSLLQ